MTLQLLRAAAAFAALGFAALGCPAALAQVSIAQGAAPSNEPAASSATPASDAKPAQNWWNQDVWADPDRGFNWYPPDRPKPRQQPRATPEPKPQPEARRPSIRELRDFDAVDAELKRLRAQAVFDPTQKNVLEYLQAQEYVISRGSFFADVARRVTWQNPEVDANSKHSIATYSATSKRERTTEQREKTLAELSRDHGLLFFYRSDCPYCHDMAPVLRAFSDQIGMQVLAVSMDGGPMPQFPNARRDNGVSRMVTQGEGIRRVPALYLVSNDTKTVQLVGTGALARDEIAERIRVLTRTRPGEEM
jgi:conjugal transfer pilus assembly protein TraF